ncbi:MAG TPA: hypothetical protein VF230_09565 [Acidimicrobiales bacterium]
MGDGARVAAVLAVAGALCLLYAALGTRAQRETERDPAALAGELFETYRRYRLPAMRLGVFLLASAALVAAVDLVT